VLGDKVFTSEALAYVVDEALQVFGGNGYSREFPAERAYRDARITRIYEGTNEINRLIIPTRLLKDRSGLQQDDETQPPFAGGLLSTERGVLARIKSLAVGMLTEAAMLYGDTIRDQQEILGHVADVVIEAYAIESAAARAERWPHRAVLTPPASRSKWSASTSPTRSTALSTPPSRSRGRCPGSAARWCIGS